MAAAPLIVSLWRGKDRQHPLCSGLLLTARHILTVRHAFTDLADQAPVYVRLIDGVDGDVTARVSHRHPDPGRDVAILVLDTAVELPEGPRLLMRSDRSFDGLAATLRVVDPKSHGRSTPSSYSVANFDHETGEYVITPDNARGHSGGVVEAEGQVIGLLSRRQESDPLCRAVAIHLIWPWIEPIIGDLPPPAAALPPLPGTGLSAPYLALLAKVRERVRRRLETSELADLARAWGADPLAGLAAAPTAAGCPRQVGLLMYALHRATETCRAQWKRLPREVLGERRDGCRFILSELVKLAVDQGPGVSDPGAAALAPVHVLCRHGGTADVVFCALADLEHLLDREAQTRGIAASNTVHFDDLLPSGQGEARRQELLQKLWKKVMNDDLPGRIEGRYYDQLLARIEIRLERDGRRYVLAAPGWRDWCVTGEYRRWADELHLGLVLHEQGRCCNLLIDEPVLIELVRDYLELVETL